MVAEVFGNYSPRLLLIIQPLLNTCYSAISSFQKPLLSNEFSTKDNDLSHFYVKRKLVPKRVSLLYNSQNIDKSVLSLPKVN